MTEIGAGVIDRGSGPPVLFLHGQPGTGASWDPVSDLLVDEFRVIAPDRAGYGPDSVEARGIAGNADLAATLLDRVDGGPAVVVAHSWAGGVAVLLAERRPDLVRSLVLVGAACTPDSLNGLDRLLGVRLVGDALMVGGLLAFGEVLPMLRKLSPRVPARFRDQFRASLPDQGVFGGELGSFGRHRRTFRTEQRALISEMPMVTNALGRVEVPTMVVVGEWDKVVRPKVGETLFGLIPGASRVVVKRAGHFLARDNPNELARLIRLSGREDAVRQ